MKIGINFLLWTIHVDEEHFHLFDKLKAVGYDGVELPLCFGDEAHYTKVARAIKDAGLECTTTSNGSPENNIISADASIRQSGLDHIKWATDMSHVLGSKFIGGPIHSSPGVFSGSGATQQEFDWAVENLRAASEYGKQADVTITVEFLNRFECYLINTVAQSTTLCEAVNHSHFGIHYDTHHAHYEEYNIADAIKGGNKHIKHVHFSENNRGTPGTGLVDWASNVSALKEIGYNDWVTLEAFTQKVDGLKQALHIQRDFFKDEEECYTDGFAHIKKVWNS
ncbi:MAG: sugar phosphate isomerase/epimerase [Lentisphaeraceae bacterium]|nr:sugar phosphate isomerase/epimerase [Lentisphaeraceae bacterium]